MRRVLSALALAPVVALVSAPVALAGASDNQRITGSDSFVARRVCTDPILVESSWSEVMHTFYDGTGEPTRMSFTGTVRITYTNLTTGVTFSPNSSGPGTLDLDTGELVIRGNNGFIFSNDGIVISTSGRIVIDPDGLITSMTGHQVDVCTAVGSAPA